MGGKGYRELVDDALARVETLSVEQAAALHGQDGVAFIDLRDRRELEGEGRIPGAVNCPRGMLEFWIDPDSPYHREVFSTASRLVFYCAAGWRSALATSTALDMGLVDVAHVDGGMAAWKDAGQPVEEVTRRD